MILTPFVGMSIFCYIGLLQPLSGIATRWDRLGVERRWLAYFVCLSAATVPIATLPLVPFRYELLLLFVFALGYDDARGAERFLDLTLLPWVRDLLWRLSRVLVDGPVVAGPVVDGPVVDGPVVDGPVVD